MKDWVFKGVIPLLAALVGVAFQAQMQASWGPWLKAVTVVACISIVAYAMGVVLRRAAPVVRTWIRDRQIESNIKHDVLALASRLVETTNTSFTLSVGNVLNKLCETRLCTGDIVNAYLAHLNTLGIALRDVKADLLNTRIPATFALARLCALHSGYIRLCASISSALSQTDRPDLKREWQAISDHANTLSTQLVEITHRVQVRRGETPWSYFESVPAP